MSPFTVPMAPEEKHAWLTLMGFRPVSPEAVASWGALGTSVVFKQMQARLYALATGSTHYPADAAYPTNEPTTPGEDNTDWLAINQEFS